MDGHKFRSGLIEVTGEGTYKCITMIKISLLKPLTSVRPSRAAPLQLKKHFLASTGAQETLIFVCSFLQDYFYMTSGQLQNDFRMTQSTESSKQVFRGHWNSTEMALREQKYHS